MSKLTAHLWEIKHPYYMSEGNYFARDCHTSFKSWGAFQSQFGESDLDYNWIVRWDWREGEGWGLGEYGGDDYYRHARFMIQMIHQRKAKLVSFEVDVCRADESAIIEFLKPRWEYMLTMWEPFAAGRQALEGREGRE